MQLPLQERRPDDGRGAAGPAAWWSGRNGGGTDVFLIPLLAGFVLDWASAFTAAYSRWWGERRGQWISALLRNVLGIPLWAFGLVLAVREPAPRLLAPNAAVEIAGWALIAGGCLLILWALAALRLRAAAPSVRDPLIRHGPYAHMRHPIYAGVLAEFAGTALLQPAWPVWLCCLLGVGWAIVQARLEELDLLRRLPAYQGYMTQVPRFVPRRQSRRSAHAAAQTRR